MATPQITPTPSATGAPQGAPGAAGPVQGNPGGSTAQALVKLQMDAQKIAGDAPETAPMMREVQNQARMATMKMIQQRQATQQATPTI